MEKLVISDDIQHSKLHKNFVKNAKFSGNIRKSAWIYKMASKGFFGDVVKNDAINFTSQIDSMITVLNNVYDKDWDFNLMPMRKNSRWIYEMGVVIHFPEITITNSEDDEHLIQDLLVSFSIQPKTFNLCSINYGFSNIMGTRFTLEEKELNIGYMHSHLGSTFSDFYGYDNSFTTKPFCLGDGTEIHDLSESLIIRYNPGVFQMFLYTISSIVAWESLEGVPYIKINKVVRTSDKLHDPSLGSVSLNSFYKKFAVGLSIDKPSGISFIANNGNYLLQIDKEFKNLVKDFILKNYAGQSIHQYLVVYKYKEYYRHVGGESQTKEQLEIGLFYSDKEGIKKKDKKPFYFRDKKLVVNFNSTKKEVVNLTQYEPHPKLLRYVATKLESAIKENLYKRGIIERKYSLIHP